MNVQPYFGARGGPAGCVALMVNALSGEASEANAGADWAPAGLVMLGILPRRTADLTDNAWHLAVTALGSRVKVLRLTV